MRFYFRHGAKSTPEWWPSADANLYGLWSNSPERAVRRLPPVDAFTSAEISAAALWSARQTSIGLRAAPWSTQVLEVFGPDNLVAHCIVYPTEGGVQVDEFDGSSRVYPCLETALHGIAPL